MAIFSLEFKIIGRGQKKSSGVRSLRTVVAAAAYRAGERLQNLVDGVVYDFTRKQGVIYSEILLPRGASERYQDRAVLWNDIEALEKRKDAQFCREVRIALPVELSHEECIKLSRAYIKKTFVDKGMIADFAFHDPIVNNGHRNPHIHVMLTMRELTPDGKLGKKNRAWNDSDNMQRWRESWAVICNKWLERGGFEQRIDHRSYKAQGIDMVPTVHLGTEAAAMERKGIRTAKGNINRAITAHNIAKECGIVEPTILANVAKQWQGVRELWGDVGSSRSFSRKARTGSSLPQETDTDRTSVQRRTYTILRNVVRQGQSPAPLDGEKYAQRGDKTVSSERKSISQRLEELRRQGEKAARPGDALRQHVTMTPTLRQAATRLSFAEWLMVLLRRKKKDAPPQQGNGHSSLYNIRVMASTLNALSKEGIGSYRQLEEKLTGLENRCMESRRQLERLDQAIVKQQRLLGAALNCQANRAVAEQYIHKVLFRDNFYKIHQRAIDAFEKGREELRAAGVPEDVTPAQICAGLEELKARRASAVEQLKQQRSEHERWSRMQERVENILDGKPVKSARRRPEPEKKQKAPRHDKGRER